MPPAAHLARTLQRRFRPFVCWFVLSAVLLAWRHHERQEKEATIQFTVSMEGRTERPRYWAELNQKRFDAGKHSGLGTKTLTIRAEDAEPFDTNLFVWYGGENLGDIRLVRSRGTLDLKIVPAAQRVSVIGQESNQSFAAATQQSLSLPTGRYKVTAQFTRFSTEQEIKIERNQTSRLVIDPGITTLALSSSPTNAEFELNCLKHEITVRSNTPVAITDLPSGEYQLRIWRGDYQKTVPLQLNPGSNELTVEFDYGRLTLSSDPVGAEIRSGNKLVGTTPVEITLPTGLHQFSVAKQGFFSSNVTVILRANEQPQVALSLLSVAYVEALEQARRYASGFPADFDRALEHVNEALRIRPNDETASKLKQSISFNRHLRDAQELRRNRQFGRALAEVERALAIYASDADALALKRELEKEQQTVLQAKAEAQRELPRRIFEETVSRLPHHDLFPSERMQFNGELAAIRSKLIDVLGRNPAWNIQRNDAVEPEVAIIQADLKGFGSRQNVLLVVGQTAENEVTIHFKLRLYQLGNNVQISLSGVSDDSYKPLHSSYASQAIMVNVERRRARDLDEFKKRLEGGLP